MGSKREGVMLAYPLDEKKMSKLPDTVAVQRKYDGERVRVEWNLTTSHYLDAVTLYSSCGNEMPYFKKLKEWLVDYGFHGINLDGEMYCHGMSREDIHSICSRRTNRHPDEDLLTLHAFDIIDYSKNQFERITALEGIPSHDNYVKKVETLIIKKEMIIHYADEFIRDGYEGVIVRNLDAFYSPRKCNYLLKWKPTEQDTYPIVGFQEEEDIYGHPKGRLGSVLVKDDDGHVFSVGTGNALDAAGRNYWWQHRRQLVGMLATVKHSSIMTVNGFPTCSSLLCIDIKRD